MVEQYFRLKNSLFEIQKGEKHGNDEGAFERNKSSGEKNGGVALGDDGNTRRHRRGL